MFSIEIVTPLHDREPWRLANLLASLTPQIREVGQSSMVVVASGSTPEILDDYRAIANQYETTLCSFRDPRGFNVSRSRNCGAKLAPPSRFIWFLDVDMLVPPGFLALLRRKLEQEPTAYWLPSYAYLPRKAAGGELSVSQLGRLFQRKWTSVGPAYGHCAVERSWFHQVRGFDESFRGWGEEDLDLWHRAQRCGREVRVLEAPLLLHQWHPPQPRPFLTLNVARSLAGRALARNPRQWGTLYGPHTEARDPDSSFTG